MRRGVAIVMLCAVACSQPPSRDAATSPAAAAPEGPAWFEDLTAARGITFVHRSGHETRYRLPEIMGGGAALFDMDGDGHLDILLVQSGRIAAPAGTPAGHRLYRNRGDGTFEDVSTGSGIGTISEYGMGTATGDYDNDGDVDVYLTGLGANVLLQNDGRGHFADVTRSAGTAGSGWSTSATFVDIDADGRLDLFVTRYLDWRLEVERECYSLTGLIDYCSPKNYDAPTSDLLFRNNGNGTFTDISRAAALPSRWWQRAAPPPSATSTTTVASTSWSRTATRPRTCSATWRPSAVIGCWYACSTIAGAMRLARRCRSPRVRARSGAMCARATAISPRMTRESTSAWAT